MYFTLISRESGHSNIMLYANVVCQCQHMNINWLMRSSIIRFHSHSDGSRTYILQHDCSNTVNTLLHSTHVMERIRFDGHTDGYPTPNLSQNNMFTPFLF